MACPHCGEVCRCTPESCQPVANLMRRFRFEPDADARRNEPSCESAILIDPEAPDYSDEHFAASLANPRPSSGARFVVDSSDKIERTDSDDEIGPTAASACVSSENSTVCVKAEPSEQRVSDQEVQADFTSAPADPAELAREVSTNSHEAPASQEPFSTESFTADGTFWKNEVAARLNYYRARRKPRPPKYPSLRLKFEPAERRPGSEAISDTGGYTAASKESVALENTTCQPIYEQSPLTASLSEEVSATTNPASTETARIIEFPRSHYDVIYTSPLAGNELADPVFETPRIVEVPEGETPAPALGGIILEPEEREPERRPGFEIPLQSAPMRRRLVATLCDGGLVLGACILFGYIFFKTTGTLPLATEMATVGVGLFALFWTTYQYLLLTYAGTTPGLRLARLDLRQFDGTPVSRRTRRWRVLASILSGVSLGLGYAWCFLDEDALCWHDRITGTHLEVAQS